MLVNVTLVGLKPADGETQLVPVTGKDGAYTFDPKTAGNKSFRLQTINATEGTCSITLEAEDYYYRTETDTVEQVGIKTVVITNRTISGSLSDVPSNGSNSQNNCQMTITIAGNEARSVNANVTRNGGNNYTWTFTTQNINNWTITYESPDQEVNIRLRFRNNSQNYYSGTCTVQDLIDGNVTGLVLTRE